MTTVSKVFAALREVIDPQKNKDIVDLGYVHNITVEDGKVSLDVILPDAEHPHAQEIHRSATKAVRSLIDVKEADIQLKAKPKPHSPADALRSVKQVIAVSSCKGGVGKSTIAVHLAQELANRGQKVGLVDCDIYGPSLPTLLKLQNVDVHANARKQLIPIEHNGMKVMSFGFLLGDQAAIMRGPIVTRYIQQILLGTDWGELDYLLIDMPPGTGDVHITITQNARLNGALIVTTPHTLSLIDVARGILMFEKVNVPILGVIENMSHFQVPGSEEKHFLFGESTSQTLEKQFGVKTLAEIPVLPALSQSQHKPQPNAFVQEAADNLERSIKEMKASATDVPEIDFDDKRVALTWKDGRRWEVSNFDLRLNSKDALSVDEMTGESRLKPENIRKDIAAKEITPLGNYAIGISWNDGHSAGIYPYKLIEELANKT